MNTTATTLLCALSFLLGRWTKAGCGCGRQTRREADRRLSTYQNGRSHPWADENKQSRAVL